MKIIKSKSYEYKEIIKVSQYDPDEMHLKLQNIIEAVHQGQDIYEAINNEFIDLPPDKAEQIKDFVKGSLYQEV